MPTKRRSLPWIPATMAGVHRVVIVGFICLRVGSLAQLAIAFSSGSLAGAHLPWLSAAAAGVLLIESVVVCVLMWRGGRATRTDLVTVDLATLALLYVLQLAFVTDAERAVTWQGWVFGVGVGFLIPIACLPSWRSTIVGGAVIVGVYWATVLPGAAAQGHVATVLANGSGLVANILGMRLVWTFLSRLGTRADDEAEAARQARAELALQNHRITHELHSQTGSLIAFLRDFDPARHAESPEELAVLTDTLWVSANRARAELSGLRNDGDGETLGGTLQRVARESAQLHLTCTTYQVDDVRLPYDVLAAISRAVTTVLENVVHHSGGREATIFANRENGRFEVSITDPGVGFDTSATHPGVGLGRIAGAHLDHHQLLRTIRSAPGQGTTVTISGPIDNPDVEEQP